MCLVEPCTRVIEVPSIRLPLRTSCVLSFSILLDEDGHIRVTGEWERAPLTCPQSPHPCVPKTGPSPFCPQNGIPYLCVPGPGCPHASSPYECVGDQVGVLAWWGFATLE